MKQKIKNTLVELIQGDITQMETDAIVKAANDSLQHGGGVAGAIVRQGGDNRIVFCLYDETAFNTFAEEMKQMK